MVGTGRSEERASTTQAEPGVLPAVSCVRSDEQDTALGQRRRAHGVELEVHAHDPPAALAERRAQRQSLVTEADDDPVVPGEASLHGHDAAAPDLGENREDAGGHGGERGQAGHLEHGRHTAFHGRVAAREKDQREVEVVKAAGRPVARVPDEAKCQRQCH